LQTISLTNIGTGNMSGQVSLILDQLSINASLYSPSGTTICSGPQGSPFVNVSVGPDGVFTPGETVNLTLQFTNTNNQAITYNTRILAGTGVR
jgi:hypothetical protein